MKLFDMPTTVLPPAPAASPEERPAPEYAVADDAPVSPWDMVSVIKRDWSGGSRPDAYAAVERHPELAGDNEILLDLAYSEYWARWWAGEKLDPAAFAARFPACEAALRRMLSIERVLENTPDVLRDAPMSWPNPGDSYLGFTLLRELGKGQFGRVFLAEEWALGNRKVVVKISKEGGAEAQTLGRLGHPNIVPVNSVRPDLATGLTVVCMPFLGETTLCDLLDALYPTADTVPPRHAASILSNVKAEPGSEVVADPVFHGGSYVEGVAHLGAGIARGLAFTHRRGVVHRDLKPANVLLGPDATPRILDFNLASDELVGGNQGGTPTFMAPEQIELLSHRSARAPVTASADLFSLGVLLFEMLAGRHPYGPLPGKMPLPDLCSHLLARMEQPPLPLRKLNPRVDTRLAHLVERCLSPDPAKRPASADAVADELDRLATEYRRRRQRVVRLPEAVLATAAIVVLLCGAGIAGTQILRERPMTPVVVAPPPRSADDLIHDAKAAFDQQDYRTTIENLNEVAAQQPLSADLLWDRARAYQKQGTLELDVKRNLALATKYFDRAVSDYEAVARFEDPRAGAARAGQGYCAGRLGLYPQAMKHYDDALEMGQGSADVHIGLGTCHLKVIVKSLMHSLQQARDHFQAAANLDETSQAAFQGLALVEIMTAKNESKDAPKYAPRVGIDYIENALKFGPRTPALLRAASEVYQLTADHGKGQMTEEEAARYRDLSEKYAAEATKVEEAAPEPLKTRQGLLPEWGFVDSIARKD